MKKLSLFLVLVTTVSLMAANAHAKATRLPTRLEKEVIDLMEDMGPDSWEEGNTDAKFDAVLYDQEKKTVYVIFEERDSTKHQPFEKRKPLAIPGIESEDDIIDVAPNGYRSLNGRIANVVLGNV